jgi:hypothetical protein
MKPVSCRSPIYTDTTNAVPEHDRARKAREGESS